MARRSAPDPLAGHAMNSVYFACTRCQHFIDAGYRWAMQLVTDGAVLPDKSAAVERILAHDTYWDRAPEWFVPSLPGLRMCLETHRGHAVVFGDYDSFIADDDHGFAWLDETDPPGHRSPRWFIEKRGYRVWLELENEFLRQLPHDRPYWYQAPDSREQGREFFESRVIERLKESR